MTTRGVRNNNPGNIDFNSSNDWQGQVGRESGNGRFARFDTPENGIRAIGKLLQTYQRRYGLDSVRALINRWAPPNENDTGSYQQAVARKLGVGVDTPIDTSDPETLFVLVQAIIKHENGYEPYEEEVVKEGVRRALT